MSDYSPFDQREKLGAPPWRPDDPAVIAWEEAHGHDVRLKCYSEFGCQVLQASAERYLRDRAESFWRDSEKLAGMEQSAYRTIADELRNAADLLRDDAFGARALSFEGKR